jgi:hypothetical protein
MEKDIHAYLAPLSRDGLLQVAREAKRRYRLLCSHVLDTLPEDVLRYFILRRCKLKRVPCLLAAHSSKVVIFGCTSKKYYDICNRHIVEYYEHSCWDNDRLLSRFTQLRSLEIPYSSARGISVSTLSQLTNLTKLTCREEMAGLPFTWWRKLRKIRLFDEFPISTLSTDLPALTSLSVRKIVLDAPAEVLQRLRRLNLFAANDPTFEVILGLTNLTGFRLIEITDYVREISRLTNLTSLRATHPRKEVNEHLIRQLPSLRSVQVTGIDLELLSGLTGLQKLLLEKNFTNVAVLSTLTNLTQLNCGPSGFSPSFLRPLTNLTCLMELRGLSINPEDLPVSLRELHFSSPDISLSHLTNLTSLGVGTRSNMYKYKKSCGLSLLVNLQSLVIKCHQDFELYDELPFLTNLTRIVSLNTEIPVSLWDQLPRLVQLTQPAKRNYAK